MNQNQKIKMFRDMSSHDIELALVYFLFDLDVAESKVVILKEKVAAAKQVLKERG